MERGQNGKGAHSCLEGAEGRPPGYLWGLPGGCTLTRSRLWAECQPRHQRRTEKGKEFLGHTEPEEEGKGVQTSSKQTGHELPKPPVCPPRESLPPAQRAIRFWGVTVWGETGPHSAPFPGMSWGAAVGGVPGPLPTGSRCPRSDVGKGYPSASPHTPYPDPRPVLSSCRGRAAGLLNGKHRLPTSSRAAPAVPAQSRSQTRCEGEETARRPAGSQLPGFSIALVEQSLDQLLWDAWLSPLPPRRPSLRVAPDLLGFSQRPPGEACGSYWFLPVTVACEAGPPTPGFLLLVEPSVEESEPEPQAMMTSRTLGPSSPPLSSLAASPPHSQGPLGARLTSFPHPDSGPAQGCPPGGGKTPRGIRCRGSHREPRTRGL